MTTTINKVDDFLEAFPNKIVKHTGRPDYEVLNNIKTALKRNFATVPCTLGGGTHGYLGAILTPSEYAAATPINTPPFVDPPFPGAAALIKEKWDANAPIEMLFDQIEDAQDYAVAAGQPYTNNQLLTTAYNLVYATGLFFDDCKAWNRLPPNQKTMENFKTMFQQAQRELRDQQRTAQQAGFQANGIWCQPIQTNDNPLQETAEALANLATATASDRQALQNLTNTVKELSNQIKAKDRQIEDLIKALNGNKTMGNTPRNTRGEKKDCGSYRHTHGYLVGPKHTSEACRQPGPNHNRQATRQVLVDIDGGILILLFPNKTSHLCHQAWCWGQLVLALMV